MHLVILNQADKQADDRDLKSDIELWKEKKSDENTDELTRAILETVLFVAIKLQQGIALLLPQAVTIFLANHPHPPEEDYYLELEYGRVKFSPRWILHQIITHLQPYMNFKCVIRCIGTLIYPRNVDPLKSLSLVLCSTHSESISDLCAEKQPRKPSNESILRDAGNIINDILHDEIRRLKEECIDLTTFNLKDSIANIASYGILCVPVQSQYDNVQAEPTVTTKYLKMSGGFSLFARCCLPPIPLVLQPCIIW